MYKKIITILTVCLFPLFAFGEPVKSVEALQAAIEKSKSVPAGTMISLKKGVYHFYADNAQVEQLYVSNHDQPVSHRVQIPLIGLKNFTLDGNGSKFVFHGASLGILLKDCENVTLKNLTLDYARPMVSEAKVAEFKDGKTRLEIDGNAFPYKVENGRLVFLFDDKNRACLTAMAFREKTHEIVESTSDIWVGNAELDAQGRVWLQQDFRQTGVGVAVGDVLALRNFDRPHPCVCIYRADNTRLENVKIHSSYGMGILAQRSRDFTMIGGGVFPRDKNYYSSTVADATHFSNVRGQITVKDALFEGMLDDAINVHSTCLKITEKIGDNRLKLRYMHDQAIGFEIFQTGETLRFIRAKTLENDATVKVKSVETLDPRQIVVTLEKPVPVHIEVGDAVENADFQPAVNFSNNIVQNNRARGALFTTPKKIVCENNLFKNVAGSAILFAGDAAGWFESGACEDVVIRKNTFVNNLTSRFQFTNAIISFYPEVKNLAEQKQFYHRNILIEKNTFNTFDVPIIFAISVDNLTFRNNKIKYNDDYRGWGQEAFQFNHCGDSIEVKTNKKNLKK